jgi:hypothetical protein
MTTTRLTLGCALALLLTAPAVGAQDAPPPQQPAPDAELVFEREVFDYPSFTRRNPFRPLSGPGGELRFEDLSLIGIMFAPDGTNSVAVLSTGGVVVNDDGTTAPVAGDAFYLKVGERIGNATIVEIRRDAVILDVQEFDAIERRTMNFISRRQGGTP